MTDADLSLLERLTACAAQAPCQALKADLFCLLTLAKFSADTLLWREINDSPDPVPLAAAGLRMMIDWVLNPVAEG